MEEILESIKKVIARDNRVGAVEQRRLRETDGLVESSLDGATPPSDDDVLDLADEAQIAMAEFYDEEADDEEESQAKAQPDVPLVTETARASMHGSLAALAMLAEPGAPPQIVRSGETSLEGMVRDLLRPALAEWLDKNLPPMVERMVATEIARIVGKKG